MEVTLAEFLAGIRKRKAALGIEDTPEETDRLRNSGTRRTAKKRARLVRIAERARAAGVDPLKSNY